MNIFARLNQAYGARVRKFKRTITHADLTAAANGAAQALDLGRFPSGAVILGRSIDLKTQFTGGAASAVGLILGDAADPDRVVTTFDVFGGTAGGANPVAGTAGVAIGDQGGRLLQATFTPDGAHTLLGLTAGEVVIEVFFAAADQAS
jgi:hypothetical protein